MFSVLWTYPGYVHFFEVQVERCLEFPRSQRFCSLLRLCPARAAVNHLQFMAITLKVWAVNFDRFVLRLAVVCCFWRGNEPRVHYQQPPKYPSVRSQDSQGLLRHGDATGRITMAICLAARDIYGLLHFDHWTSMDFDHVTNTMAFWSFCTLRSALFWTRLLAATCLTSPHRGHLCCRFSPCQGILCMDEHTNFEPWRPRVAIQSLCKKGRPFATWA